MAVSSRVEGIIMKRKRLIVDGLLVGSVRSGLDFDVATSEITESVYGSVSGVNLVTYESGPQSIEVLEDPNSSLTNEMFAGIPDRNPAEPTLIGSSATVTQRHAVVETLNQNHDGYGLGSTALLHWAASFGTPRNDPSGIAVRTISGPADRPIEISSGEQWLCRRVDLTSGGSGWTGTWTSPLPLLLAQSNDEYAVYLEIQSGDGFDRETAEIEVDTSNVQPSGSGGEITIPHQDVIDAGFVVAGITHAWVIFAHNESALQDHEYRWGTS
jgi:hypothetical protein